MKLFKKVIMTATAMALTASLFAGCAGDSGSSSGAEVQFQEPQKGQQIATIKIKEYGDIKIMLFDEQAPKAVENFTTHAKDGYYDGVTFHRVMTDFMIQGGDPDGNGTGGESIWGDPFEDEFTSELRNFTGALSMANAGPKTNGSQFFIVQADETAGGYNIKVLTGAGFPQNVAEKYMEVGGTPHLDFRHTVFGQVIGEGLKIVDEIANVKVGRGDKPMNDVVIEGITVINNPYTK